MSANVDATLKEGLERYVEHGIVPGGFLRAVLENDFLGAVSRADVANSHNLRAIADYVYLSVPATAWGSPEAVHKWAKAKLALRREAEETKGAM